MSWSARLLLLALRRAASPIARVVIALVLALARWREEARALELARLVAASAPEPAAAAREALWTLTALFLVPYCVVRAARTFSRWRAGELDFLAPRAAPRVGLAGATFLGHAAATVLVALLVALACEAGRARTPSWADAGTVALPRTGWITGAAPFRALLPEDASIAGARIELELVLGTGAGPATEVVLRARRAGRGDWSSEARRRVGTRDVVEVELPPGTGAVELELALVEPAARVLLPADVARVWKPATDARGASLALAAELVLLAVAASAVAFLLGAFLSPSIASAGVLALWLVPGILGVDGAWLPGHGLFDALACAGRARVPAGPAASACAVAGALALASIAAVAAGPAAGRRTR
ncbi:MAG: hypothetical protein HZA53_15530 [Planctomycetes bacterium]|nr:hypothetical protein [Planctomycetota bacterium]